jgi:hypothetical protein
MLKKTNRSKQNKQHSIKSSYTMAAFIFSLLFMSLCLPLLGSLSGFGITRADQTYVPAVPTGPTYGFINTEYEYEIPTTNPTASWMFDWGDGTYSTWVSLDDTKLSVTQSHLWNTPDRYHVRVKYRNEYFQDGVWSNALDVIIVEPVDSDFPDSPVIISGQVYGCTNRNYSYTIYATDPKEDNIQYRFDWGDETISEWTAFVRSGESVSLTHQWVNVDSYEVKAQVRDVYGLESPWSDSFTITLEVDSDSDSFPDACESQVGSSLNDPSDAQPIIINEIEHYIVYPSPGVQTALFYNSTSRNSSTVGSIDETTFLIDDDNDGQWEYCYARSSGIVTPYEDKPSITTEVPWWLVVVSLIIAVLLIVVVLFKMGILYVYEEYTVEE